MRKLMLIALGICFYASMVGQEDQENIDRYITAIVASDTILAGNTFEFKIVIRNLKGDFTPPTFADFDMMGGPNLSTSMQYTNGNMFRESTYTYYLRARKVGENYIEESYLSIDGENMETAAIPVYIVDNPEAIERDYRIRNKADSELVFPFSDPSKEQTKPKKPKRKLKKI